MSKLILNFFGEEVEVDKPKTLSSLRNIISQVFALDSQDSAEIIIIYDKNGQKITITNDEDLKMFLDSNINKINLDISQNSKIYKDNLNKLQEQNLKDKQTLEQLLKKQGELKKLKEIKIIPLKEELKSIESEIFKLFQRKNDIRKKIFEENREIEKKEKENNQKIQEIQKKLGIIKENNKKSEKNHKFSPGKINLKFNPPCPNVHPRFFERKYYVPPNKNRLRGLKVKFAKTEYIDIPKDSNTLETESNESKNELDLKMKTIDDWGKQLSLKTLEISNKLIEKFKDVATLNISPNIYNTINNEDNKEEKEIHPFITCDGCKMSPLIGKRYKCKRCGNFDYCEKCYEKNKVIHGHEFKLIEKSFRLKTGFIKNAGNKSLRGMRPEFVPKKMEFFPSEGKILEKETMPKKVIHKGVKCDQCGKNPIIGCRYKCSVCPNFDFCEECEQKYAGIHNHVFFKIPEPSMRALIFKNFSKK